MPIVAAGSSSSIFFIFTAITAPQKGPYKNYGLIQPENPGKLTKRLGEIGMKRGRQSRALALPARPRPSVRRNARDHRW